jgi:4-hydroxy-2-oxoheptanedioate aldolase
MIVDRTLQDAVKSEARPLIGMWLCSGSPIVTEICAGAGLDWLLIDAEHSANSLAAIQLQLQVLRGLPPVVMVRAPSLDPVLIKQYLDVGVQNLLIPMVNDAEQAGRAVAATRYPPAGVRGVGATLSRVSQWSRIPDYLHVADASITLIVQIETAGAVEEVESILAVDGIDGIFVGPADLAACLGVIGEQANEQVVEAVERCIEAAGAAGKPCGVNAFDRRLAQRYLEHGAGFVLVGADVTVLARGSESLASEFLE